MILIMSIAIMIKKIKRRFHTGQKLAKKTQFFLSFINNYKLYSVQ